MSAHRFGVTVDLDRGDQAIEARNGGHKVPVEVRRIQLPNSGGTIAGHLFFKTLVVELLRDLLGKQRV